MEQQEMRMQLAHFIGDHTMDPIPLKGQPFLVQRRDEASIIAKNKTKQRQLNMYNVGQTATSGCYQLPVGTPTSLTVSSATACGTSPTFPCPDCFTTEVTAVADMSLTIAGCSSAYWVSTVRTGTWEYTFVNPSSYKLLIYDGVVCIQGTSPNPCYTVPANSFTKAYCTSTSVLTGAYYNKLTFPSTTLPTLSVTNAILLGSGDFDASTSSGVFKTSTGVNTLGGSTSIASSKTFTTGLAGTVILQGSTSITAGYSFTVGSVGPSPSPIVTGSSSYFYGNVVVGSSTLGSAIALSLYSHVSQLDQTVSSANVPSTLSTGTGTISLNGATSIASGKAFSSSGTGTFGVATFNGNVVISSSYTFTSGTGAVSLLGSTVISSGKTFTVGVCSGCVNNPGSTSTFYGNVVIGNSGNDNTQTAIGLSVYGNVVQADTPISVPASAYTLTTASGIATVNGHLTIANNKNLAMGDGTGTGTFTTAVGSVSLQGATTILSMRVTGTTTLSGATYLSSTTNVIGPIGATGMTTEIYGNVVIGKSNLAAASQGLSVYGNSQFLDGTAGTATFGTGSGTISLNGAVSIALGKNLVMSGNSLLTAGNNGISTSGVSITNVNGLQVGGVTIGCDISGPTPNYKVCYGPL